MVLSKKRTLLRKEKGTASFNFHSTILDDRTSIRMLIVFFFFYFINTLLCLLLFKLFQTIKIYKTLGTGNLVFISFIFCDLLSTIATITLFSKNKQGNSLNKIKSMFNLDSYKSVLKHWFMVFYHDFLKNIKLILLMGIILVLIQIIFNSTMALIFNNGKLIQSTNSARIIEYFKQNFLMLIAATFIAPITEELTFRYLLTNTFKTLISKFVKPIGLKSKCIQPFIYWISALFSGCFFAIAHQDSPSPILFASYVLISLYLQLICKKTNSITAPSMVHGVSNMLVLGISIL